MTLLEGIRKMAARQYQNQPWGGSITDAEPMPSGSDIGGTVAGMSSSIGADRIFKKALGRNLPLPVSSGVYEATDLAYQGLVGGERRRRSAENYGRRLAQTNPYLSYRVR